MDKGLGVRRDPGWEDTVQSPLSVCCMVRRTSLPEQDERYVRWSKLGRGFADTVLILFYKATEANKHGGVQH